jgi:citrate synthase
MELKSIFEEKIKEHKAILNQIVKEHGDEVIGEVTIDHLFHGVRGLPVTYTPTSHVDPNLGVMYRGKSLQEVNALLPKFADTDIVSAESVFWFLLTGEVPTQPQIETLRRDIHMHSNVPHHVFNVIDSLPANAGKSSHTMKQMINRYLSNYFVAMLFYNLIEYCLMFFYFFFKNAF